MRISVFLDGANFFFMQREALGWFADPKKILDYIATEGDIVDAFYYIGHDTPPEAKQQSYLVTLEIRLRKLHPNNACCSTE
ncbi:NYN domain-containing protein [Sphaerospermopsis aphanizomenoides BCCUSP55]|uniref:NYN domain-containing protein n=1 Tax=Sphaerospermopsis aphanizomenoides TaxID=459663 RepID=UPI0019031EA9|nr:NYN domain-containing protein [Sphaerospermopsis aphanizomenoides]MBK1986401.1 NYN domain-containing protein [Sphaerospermopsis aphanizomenoides BCCUSP55]